MKLTGKYGRLDVFPCIHNTEQGEILRFEKQCLQDQSREACSVIRENLNRTRFASQAKIVQSDYQLFLKTTKEKYDIILLDPPYAEVFLENSLKLITEIDILQSGGIIATERPLEKDLSIDFSGYERSKDYKYGKTLITLYRKL